jgi:hypothetical protein
MHSSSFDVTPVDIGLTFMGNSTVQRTQEMNITIVAKYHDGSNFLNVTQTQGGVTDASGKQHSLALNSTLDSFVGHFKIPVDGTLGLWRVSATVTDIYGNKASGDYAIQIVKADLKFAVKQPASVERTLTLNVTARITYPDSTPVSPSILVNSGLNLTISVGNTTIIQPMTYKDVTGSWIGEYVLPQNATLGDYSARLNVTDLYGNSGNFAAVSKVVPARFRIFVPQPTVKAPPLTPIDVPLYVRYPNGSALTPRFHGVVEASLTNSSGTFTLPLFFNASGGSWHLLYVTPNIGFSFGATITFSFQAQDGFGNAGAVQKAVEVDVGAGTEALILSAVIAAVVPAALVGWAIVTVTSRRRKHKP